MMDQLHWNQVVLLALLVSFVTSIATGIVTVTLMDQAPPAVTQTVNRIVERTIEKVVPGEPKTTTVVKEVPVVVTEEQLIVDVINKTSPGILRLVDNNKVFLGSAFAVSSDGYLITVDHLLPANLSTRAEFGLYLNDGRNTAAKIVKRFPEADLVVLKADLTKLADPIRSAAVASTTTDKSPANKVDNKGWLALPFGNSSLQVGQTVVALGYTEGNSVAVSGGIISSLTAPSASSTVAFLHTGAANQSNLGGPVLNTKGVVVGMSKDLGLAISATDIRALIESAKASN